MNHRVPPLLIFPTRSQVVIIVPISKLKQPGFASKRPQAPKAKPKNVKTASMVPSERKSRAISTVMAAPNAYKTELASGLRALGSGLGGAISNIFGFGDYQVRRNSLVFPSKSDQVPAFGSGNGAVRIRHREYLGEVYGSIPFNITSYNINPADPATFPWLSNIAVNFEQWMPHGIVFDFRSMSSETQISTATTALGTVILGTEYNALASRFTSKQTMEASQFAVSVKPSASVMHPIECDLSQTPSQPLYVRLPNSSAVNADPRLYDLGRFQVATQGMTVNGGDQGELWVTYDIEMLKPVLQDPLSQSVQSAHYSSIGTWPTALASGSNYDVIQHAMTRIEDTLFTGISFTPGSHGGVNLTFPPGLSGTYLLTLTVVANAPQSLLVYAGAPGGTKAPVYNPISNIVLPLDLLSNTASSLQAPTTLVDTQRDHLDSSQISTLTFSVTDPSVGSELQIYFGLDANGYPTIPYTGGGSAVQIDLMIAQVATGF